MSKLFVYMTGVDHETLDKSLSSFVLLLDENTGKYSDYSIAVIPAEHKNGVRVMGRRVALVNPDTKLIAKLAKIDFTKEVDVRISEVKA